LNYEVRLKLRMTVFATLILLLWYISCVDRWYCILFSRSSDEFRSSEEFRSSDTNLLCASYASLLETIRLVSAEQATVFSGKKKNYADIVKFREVLESALATQPCTTHDGGYSWLSRHWRRLHPQDQVDNTIYSPVHAKRTIKTNSTPKIRIIRSIQAIHNLSTNKNTTNTSTGTMKH
jgi:hypothetical protein